LPRYHFHLHDRTGFTEDPHGRTLPDAGRARERAIREARAIICDDVRNGCVDLNGRIEVTDGSGKAVLTLSFTEAVDQIDARLSSEIQPT
jgi:hypothetical protein